MSTCKYVEAEFNLDFGEEANLLLHAESQVLHWFFKDCELPVNGVIWSPGHHQRRDSSFFFEENCFHSFCFGSENNSGKPIRTAKGNLKNWWVLITQLNLADFGRRFVVKLKELTHS